MFINVSVQVLALFMLIKNAVSCYYLLIKLIISLEDLPVIYRLPGLHYQDFSKYCSGCDNNSKMRLHLPHNQNVVFEWYV